MEEGGTEEPFQDLDYHTPLHIVFSSGAIMVLILLSLFGNTLVCVAVYSSRTLQTHVNYFIVSLSVSDILIASISMPIWMTFEITKFKATPLESHMESVLKVWTFFDILGAVASIMNLAGISLERYLSVKSPLSHRRCMTNSWVAWGLLMIWLYALVAAGTYVLFWDWYWNTTYIALLGFFVPLSFIIVAYLSVLHVIARSSRQVVSGEEHRRVSITVCVVVGVFVMCWLPFFSLSLAGHYCHACHMYVIDNQWLRSLVKWMHYLNSCINPFIYGVFNAQYRDAFKRLMRRLCLKAAKEPMEPTVNPFRDRADYHVSSTSLYLPTIADPSMQRRENDTLGASCAAQDEATMTSEIGATPSCHENGDVKEHLLLARKEPKPRYHPHPAFLRVDLGPNRSTAIMS